MQQATQCILNNRETELTGFQGTIALDFIRKHLKLPGTKEGCREGECGACTVLLGERGREEMKYKTVASCLLPIGQLAGKHVVTVEGLNQQTLTPVQRALVEEGGSQCGFCTPGIVLSLTGFFLTSPLLSYNDAVDALDGNICRCTGYASIRRAVGNLCDQYAPKLDPHTSRIRQLIRWDILPDYFKDIPKRLETLKGVDNNGTMDHTPFPPPSKKGKKQVLVAGATDLLVQKPDAFYNGQLEFITRFPQLTEIKQEGNTAVIGAAATVEDMKHTPFLMERFPTMKEHLNLISSTIMRNRATPGGNIANASPIGDLSIIFLALDAVLTLSNGSKKRQVPLKQFFTGYKQMDMKKDEAIETISFPLPPGDVRYHFEKVSQRKYLDIASCNSAATIKTDGETIETANISAGGVAPIPLLLEKTCGFLEGKPVSAETIRSAAHVMEEEIAPISDVRGSADYKRLLMRNLFYAHFITLFPHKDLGPQLIEPGARTKE